MIETEEAMALLAGRSENTRRNYISGLKKYCEFRNLQPNELIDEIEENVKKSPRERERVDREVKKFYDWLREEKNLSVGSVQVCITAVRAFYRDNGFPLKPLRLPTSRIKKENIRRVLRAEEVKKMVNCCKNLRDRVIVLMMFQGGFDTQTLLSLDYGDVKEGLKKGEAPLVIQVVRQKEGIDYKTCIGHDAIEALKLYLYEREMGTRYIPAENLKPDSPLFISERVYDKKKHERLANIGVGIVFKDIARRAGVVDMEDLKRSDINIVGAHALRKSFSTICRNSGVPPDLVEYMIGHRLKFNGAYYGPSGEELTEEYRKVEPSLSISQTSVRIGDESAVSRVEMLKEIAETFEIRFDYLRDRFMESHNLSNEIDIEEDPELLKDFRDYIRAEIDTRYERQMMQVLEAKEPKMREEIEDSLGPAVPKVEMLKEIAEIFDIRADSLLDNFIELHDLSNEGDIIKDPELLKDLRGHIREEINRRYENWTIQLQEEGGLNKYLVYKCTNCGMELEKSWEICPKCGKRVGFTICDNCGETLSHDWKYCSKCGEKL
ncbi:MAG: tyrosine-type recombinase/integrase [Halobacteriota archaeon]